MVDNKSHSSLFASAVTLSSGDLFMTGGKDAPHDAFLISQFDLTNWRRLPQMKHGRFAHSSCNFVQDEEEFVIVAGGWGVEGDTLRAQAFVEIYNLSEAHWRELTSLPSPRVYFSLQVAKHMITEEVIVFIADDRCWSRSDGRLLLQQRQ